MASTAVLAAAGLVTSPNQLNRPDGSLTEASNIVIKRDGIIEQRRGFSVYGNDFPSSSQRAKQVTSYRERIIRHYSNRLQFDSNGLGKFVDIDGSVVETETGLRIRFVESSGNLYFTTLDGIKKLSAKNAEELSTLIVQSSGVQKALDLQAKIKIVDNLQTGFLPQDSKVAYRLVWNKEDNNNNLLTGTPSQRAEVTLSLSELLVRDTMRILQALDELNNTNPSLARIDNKNYLELLKLQLSSTPGEIRSKLLLLAEKLDNDIILANQTGTAPLKITGAEVVNKVCTLSFEKVEAVDLTALNALPTKQTYIIYKTTIDNKLYAWNGTTFEEKDLLKEYFSTGLNIELSGFELSTRKEVQIVKFTNTTPTFTPITSGTFTLKYKGDESPAINATDSNAVILTKLQTVTGLEKIDSITGSKDPTGLTLTFLEQAGNLDELTVGSNSLSPTSSILINNSIDGIAETEGDLNAGFQILEITENTIKFNSDVVGVATVTPTAEIKYNEFRSIKEPVEPSTPALNYELVEIQDYLDNILTKLQNLPNSILEKYTQESYPSISNFPLTGNSTTLYTAEDTKKTYLWNGSIYVEGVDDKTSIDNINLTKSSLVELNFTLPDNITINDFYQLYRSTTSQALEGASLEDLVPNDEMKLVYEAYPTEQDIQNREITILDETDDIFKGANLYTNASTGEGILQANDQAPFSTDINRYRNSVFYSNTRTKHRYSLNMLGVQNMKENFDTTGIYPKITITDGDTTNTYRFVVGQQQIIKVVVKVDNTSNVLNGKYFKISSPSGKVYVPYLESTLASNPAVGDEIGIKIEIQNGATKNDIAKAISNKFSTLLDDFSTIYSDTIPDTAEIVSIESGYSGGFEVGNTLNTEIELILTQEGKGEKIQEEISQVNPVDGASYANSGTSDYFQLNTALNQNIFVFYFKKDLSVAPLITNAEYRAIEVTGTETISEMVDKIYNKIPTEYFEVTKDSVSLTIKNLKIGPCDQISKNPSASFTVARLEEGAIDVLLSPVISNAQAIDQTSKSLVKIINKNRGESVNAFYTSSVDDAPGKIFLESRSLSSIDAFYLLANNSITGTSFNPDISPDTEITSITQDVDKTIITTSSNHNLITGDEVIISSTNSNQPIDGIHIIEKISNTSYSIPVVISTNGDSGSCIRKSISFVSENERKVNRIYYSKFNEPESVPIVNYLDLGASDKKILRILPLRDSLFVFKEDGLFRISGESAPFQSELFDNSFILSAPDSLDVCNNVIYAWTTQGIQALTEGGASVISRNIDNIILKTQSSNYKNFKTATWGIGYESDNSYLVFTVKNTEDETAQIAYRYSTLTNTWTTYDKSFTCGHIADFDDHFYAGASDIPSIEKERKTFSRLDYADREYVSTLSSSKILKDKILLPTVSNFDIGDVLVQNQTITVYDFNQLLNKLDLDSGPDFINYFEELELKKGESPRSKLLNLANKLDSDLNTTSDYYQPIESKTGTISLIDTGNETIVTSNNHGLIDGRVIQITLSNSTPSIDGKYTITLIDENNFKLNTLVKVQGNSGNWQTVDGDFEDLKVCYNKIVDLLNVDDGVNFNNYKKINKITLQETIITDLNKIKKEVTVNLDLPFLVGEIVVFKSINSSIEYSPNTFGDPLNLKHLREATLMFETRTLTSGILSFATDLLPEFIKIPFNLEGNGIFGHQTYGENFFGGLSNSAPFRTYVPRQCQRCRYIVAKFTHKVAREDWRLLGMTITGQTNQSTRAFR